MKHVVAGTLDALLSAPHFHKWSWEHVSVAAVSTARKAYKPAEAHANSVAEALEFYCLNHLFGLVRNRFNRYEDLPGWAKDVAEAYLQCLSRQTLRLFYYQTVISIREARHLKIMSDTWWNDVTIKFGANFRLFQDKNKGDEGAALTEFDTNPPPMSFTMFMLAITHVFRNGMFNKSYGGPKWAKVNDNLTRFITGEITAETFVDTGYTLAHNTAPIFNKGIYYSPQMGDKLITVLDLQRAGYIPSYLIANPGQDHAGLLTLINLVRVSLPDHGIEDTVDWKKVMAAGAVQNYNHMISGDLISSLKKAKSKGIAPSPTKPKYPGIPANGEFVSQVQYYPGEVLTVYKRSHA